MGTIQSSNPDVAVVISYSKMRHMLAILNDHGIDRMDFVKWLGVTLDKMIFLEFVNYDVCRMIAYKLDNLLHDFYSDIYSMSINLLRIYDRVIVNNITMLSDDSIVFYVNKDANGYNY